MKKVTIKDVGEYADVSPSTVSRVISNDKRISDETKKKVREAIKKLGYHPNAIARSLVTQKTKSMGLILSRPAEAAFANPFFPGIIQGIASIAQEEEYNLLLAAAKDYHREHEEALDMLRNGKVDGVILMAPRVNDDIIQQLLDFNYPFVLIGRSIELRDIPIVNNDNIKAAYDAVKFLIKKGQQKIAFLSGPEEYVVSRDRLTGYKKALKENGIKVNSDLIKYSSFTYEGGYENTMNLLKSKNDIDAVFAVDDMIASGALRAAQNMGLNVPEELAVMGFNDDPMAVHLRPALSTVKIPIVEMGKKAAQMLLQLIHDDDYKGEKIIIPTKIIERDTTN
ncbi:MAG: LacI family DNA-binding transcriptional regulator [Halothermotrichaceae bacterium]